MVSDKFIDIKNLNFDNMNRLPSKYVIDTEESFSQDIAIIGMSAKLPKADNVEEFWKNIRNGVDCVRDIPVGRKKDIERYLSYINYPKDDIKYLQAAFLDEIDKFDYKFFRLTPREASLMNPLQRIFLETAWETIEDAGYGGKKLSGSKTGVYLGYIGDMDGYQYKEMISRVEGTTSPISYSGNLASIMPSRISYLLDLKGPSINIDAACSSSLIAIHLACRALQNGDCEMALAGGIKLHIIPLEPKGKVGIESSNYKTKTFNDDSDGTGFGEGVAAIFLKPLNRALADKDNIYAVIKGSASNQDGNSIGITAPNVEEQANVIIKAWSNAGINPETLTYFEAHGTGTKLGDPIEIAGIQKAFSKFTDKKQFCAIGSVKTNIGHLFEASGVVSIVKTVMMMRHGEIPPSIHFTRPNRNIDFEQSPIYLNDTLVKWETDGLPKRCGVSSFGFSGTNCHIVLEEAPKCSECINQNEKQPFMFALSAIDIRALEELLIKYKTFLQTADDLDIGGLSYTMLTGRGHYSHRLAFTFSCLDELKQNIDSLVADGIEKNLDIIYFGVHKLILQDKVSMENGSITTEMKRSLSDLARLKSVEFSRRPSQDAKVLDELCDLYVKGAEIDWNILFGGAKYRKMNLPTYPFQRERCWVEITSETEELSSNNGLFYTIGWNKKVGEESLEYLYKKTIMVFKDKKNKYGDTIQILRAEGIEVIEVEIAANYEKIDGHRYTVGNSLVDYNTLFNEACSKEVSYILHLASIADMREIEDIDQMKNSQDSGVMSLFYITKAFLKNDISNRIRIFIISQYVNEVSGEEERINPENATLFGLSGVISQEYPNITCKCMDIDEYTTGHEIVHEMKLHFIPDTVAYRNGKRYEKEFRDVDVDVLESNQIDIKDGNVYLITGGTGGIGLEIANFISSNGRVKLGLLSRTGMPKREYWDEFLEKGTDIEIINRINAIKSIESSGTEVLCLKADVNNREDIKNALNTLRSKYEKIDGIFHCAGVAGDGFILNKDETTFKNVLMPKVLGTWSIYQLTQDDQLDFFVMFSSAATILNIAGQGDYRAANSYLDSFSAFMRRKNRKALTVNWVAWKETGMALRKGFKDESVFKALNTKEAIEAFSFILKKDIGQVLIGELNLDKLTFDLAERFSLRLSQGIRQRLCQSSGVSSNDTKGKKVDFSTKFKLMGNSNRAYSEAEKTIAGICCEELGFKEIDVNQSFFDMGANSILLTQIYKRINDLYPNKLSITKMYAYPTISKLALFITAEEDLISRNKPVNTNCDTYKDDDIAIIGISAKFPKADSVNEFWRNLRAGLDSINDFPESRKKDMQRYLQMANLWENNLTFQKGAYLNEIDNFDYKFFKMSPKEASLMDPNQRMFLQTAWSAIEDAGYGGDRIAGSRTGIYVGFATNIINNYSMIISKMDPSSLSVSIPGNMASIIAGRVSYVLDLKGPSLLVDTACSSSLVAVHLACNALKKGECELAIAGGVKINLLPIEGKIKLGIESSDDRTRTFDDSSDGTGIGEGVAAVLLKPIKSAIQDGDNIYSVIKGSAVNQDGYSVGITAPNSKAQTDVILNAWENANIDPETITFIEAHGTGTKIGDPIEIEGLQSAFKKYTDKKQFCAISSVKTNIGHLYEGAGIAGLIKAVMSLKQGELVPNVHFEKPNHRINFEDSPVYVNTQLAKWETEGYPRRCGVSAFGFSGTNCHVVLEEYRDKGENSNQVFTNVKNENCGLKVLALSGKTSSVLMKILNDYREFLKSDELSIEDICFTANTGRGHYSYRLAIIAENLNEFRQKINDLITWGFDHVEDKRVYYSKNNVMNEDKRRDEKASNALEEKNLMSQQVHKNVDKFLASDKNDENLLREICRLYINGAEVKWIDIYEGEQRKKISIPVYPFERYRCWVEEDCSDDRIQHNEDSTIHPLLDICLAESMNQDIYSTKFNAKRHFVLSDHIIEGSYVIPGTTYVEMAVELGRRYYPDSAIELQDVLFTSPFILEEDESREVHTIINKKGEYLEFIIASLSGKQEVGKEWLRHAEGKICKIEEPFCQRYSIRDLKETCGYKELKIEQNNLTGGFIRFGPRWLNYHKLWIGENMGLAEIIHPKQFKKDLENYYIHPAMLDMAVAALILISGNKYLPLSYKFMKFYGPTPAKFFSYVKANEKRGDGEIISYDVTLIDSNGDAFAVIEDYKLKKVHEFNKPEGSLYHKINWKLKKLNFDTQELIKNKRPVMVFKDGGQLGEAILKELRSLDIDIIEVEPGVCFEKLANCRYVISGAEEDYERLIDDIKGISPSHIIHLPSLNCKEYRGNITNIEACLTWSIYSLFYLSKKLVKSRISPEINILLVSSHICSITGEEEDINPFGSGLFGLAKVVENEYKNIRCSCVDIDSNVSAFDIILELMAEKQGSVVAYRNKKRYIEELDTLDIKTIPESRIEIKENGVYVITGGTGGIGLEICKQLSSRNRIQLALINRSKLPDRMEWNDILEKGDNQKLCNIIKTIKEIEDAGGKLICYSADVSNIDELTRVLDDVRRRLGKINGVMHCAGVAGDGFIFTKGIEKFRSVILPKIYGSLNLEYLVRDDKPDFLIFFSSIASVIALAGQGDYTAANSFMDSFAQYCCKTGLKGKAINWPAWKETGMAKDYGVNVDTMFKAISTEKAVKTFEKVLARDIDRVIIGELNYSNLASMEKLPITLSSSLNEQFQKLRHIARNRTGNIEKKGRTTSVSLIGKNQESYNDIELRISQIWGNVLGVKEINVYDSFFDMGGNSLLATRLLEELKSVYKEELDIADVFSYPSISEMAKHINSKINISICSQNEKITDSNQENDDNEFESIMDKLANGIISIEEADSLIKLKGGEM